IERPAEARIELDYEDISAQGESTYSPLNYGQKHAVDAILASFAGASDRLFFIDGPGGSGKAYLYNTLYNILDGRRLIDEIVQDNQEDEIHLTTEYLISLTPFGMPPHELYLKDGAIVTLLRNLDITNGLCNGTRLRIQSMGQFTLGCGFVSGLRKGEFVLIPRTDNCCDTKLPFRMRRRQFPVQLAFAITINKSQGQASSKLGLH
ncbi:uncharacterized protein LOC100898242, partial [Galendromus occidentalis]|uniref:ATP-dependent DNA helicase n=1 Tax=Galendromus occidentalis TaxID=34638 RepID=A0AAJ7SHH4_9ACAR